MTEQLSTESTAFQTLLALLNRSRVRISLERNTWVVFDNKNWRIYQKESFAREAIVLYEGFDFDEMIRIANKVCDE